jgi:hypothetical protein
LNEVDVTAYQPYQAYPGQAPVPAAPPPILVAAADPVPQRRATVAFRLILAIPHLFLLYILSLAAGVVLFIGWWGALFTGRLPQFAVTFLGGVLHWQARVQAYYLLLTDAYPPFSMDDVPTYPVRVAIPEPQRLNRAAVFFRFFLMIPAELLGGILLYGACTLMAFIAWLITLFAGQLPTAFHQAYVAVVRFQTRLYGYYYMLTPAYPGGLYGDKPGAVAWADALPAAPQGYGATPGFGTPGPAYGAPQGFEPTQGYGGGYGSPQTPGYGTPQGPGYGAQQPPQAYGTPGYSSDTPGYGAPAGYGAQQPYGAQQAPQGYGGYGAPAGYGGPGGYGLQPVVQPVTWLLTLTSGAKNLVTTFIVLGVVVSGGYGVAESLFVGSAVSTAVNSVNTSNRVVDSFNTLADKTSKGQRAVDDCGNNMACVSRQETTMAGYFQTFSDEVAGTPVPASAAAAKAKVLTDAATLTQDYQQLAAAKTDAQYQATAGRLDVQGETDTLNNDVNALVDKLRNSA